MSGVKVGSRLDQLRALRVKLDLEIAQEERRVAVDGSSRVAPLRPRRAVEVNRVDCRLRELGVTSREVKVWAVGAGLIPEVKRGRVAEWLVEAFADARTSLNQHARAEA